MLGVVECLYRTYSKFPAESGSERIFKIGLVLTKLQPKFRGFVFFGTQCIYIYNVKCNAIKLLNIIHQ